MPYIGGVVVKKTIEGKVTCQDCDFVRYKRTIDASKTFYDSARWHAGHYDHTVVYEKTTKTVFSASDTINGVTDGQNKEEDLPSDPRGSERNDVAPVGGVRSDAEMVRRRLDRARESISTETVSTHEANMRRALAVSGSFMESLARHPSNKS